jgi:hypothetical protein
MKVGGGSQLKLAFLGVRLLSIARQPRHETETFLPFGGGGFLYAAGR